MFDDALCIAMCQKGLRDRMLHHLWIPVAAVVMVGFSAVSTKDITMIGIWAILVGVMAVSIFIRFAYLCRKCRRLVETLQGLDMQDFDLQLGAAKAWGGSVYLLDAYLFAPQYFLLVPYEEIERFRVKTWTKFSFVTTDIQLTFYNSKKKAYKTMLKQPQQFDQNQFQNALQNSKNAAHDRRQS